MDAFVVESMVASEGSEWSSINFSSTVPPTNGMYVCDKDATATIILIVCFACGILGNSSLIALSLVHKDMRTPSNLMIVNLAIGDLLFLLFVFPSNLSFYLDCDREVPLFFCKLEQGVQFVSQGVSVLTLTALSFERYQVIARPFLRRRSGQHIPKQRMFLTAFWIWVLSILCAVPVMKWADVDTGICTLPWNTMRTQVYFSFLFLFLYVVPLFSIFVFYALTIEALLHGLGGHFNQTLRTGNERRQKSRIRLAIIILIVAMCFAICWLPYYIFILWFEFADKESKAAYPAMDVLMYLHYFMPNISSCINPILLFAMSSNYRRKLRNLFCWDAVKRTCGTVGAKSPIVKARRKWTLVSLRTPSTSRASPSALETQRSSIRSSKQESHFFKEDNQ